MFCLSSSRLLAMVALASLLALGCSKTTTATPDGAATEAPAVETTPSVEAIPSTESNDAPIEKESPRESTEAVSAYQPPFPNRVNPFAPPKAGPRRLANSDREMNASVSLIGFANVGGPKVVLAIDGMVSPLASGEEIAGVRVISITPPHAVLQRGRNRWTASLN